MSMSKKDYVAIASVINRVASSRLADLATVTAVIGNLNTYFASDNPNYQGQRFIAACLADIDTDRRG